MKEIRVKISKDGTLTLPKEVKDEFKGSSVAIVKTSNGVMLLNKEPKYSWSELADRLREAGEPITQKDIDQAIREVRSVELKRRFK